ncbi:hypothetical protein [Terriglobus tenax]|nr:hypothetical protein [Terriglobus tenax]
MKTEEQSSLARGLLWLALVVVVFALWRAATHHTLGAGWWKPW